MTSLLRRKPRTTRPAKSTPSRTACRLLLAAVGLGLAGTAAAQDGRPASSFRPRTDAPASLVIPVQAKSTPGTPPTTTPPGTVPPGTAPGVPMGKVAPGTVSAGEGPGHAAQGGTGDHPGHRHPAARRARSGAGRAAGRRGRAGRRSARCGPARTRTRLTSDWSRRAGSGCSASGTPSGELEERMRQERRDSPTPGDPIQFPPKPGLTDKPYEPRQFAPMTELREPDYVVYRRCISRRRTRRGTGGTWASPSRPSRRWRSSATRCCSHTTSRRTRAAGSTRTPASAGRAIRCPTSCTHRSSPATGLLAEVGAVGLLFYAVLEVHHRDTESTEKNKKTGLVPASFNSRGPTLSSVFLNSFFSVLSVSLW